MDVSVIVSKRQWGYALLGVCVTLELSVLFLLPRTTAGPGGPINNEVYGTFVVLLLLAVAVVSFVGYRVEGRLSVEDGQVVLWATHSLTYSVGSNPVSRWRVKRAWKKGDHIRVDSGWDQLRISFQDQAEMLRFVSECGRLFEGVTPA